MAAPLTRANGSSPSLQALAVDEEVDTSSSQNASTRKRKYSAISPSSEFASSSSSSSSSSAVIEIDPSWVEAAGAASSATEEDVERQRLLRRKAVKLEELPAGRGLPQNSAIVRFDQHTLYERNLWSLIAQHSPEAVYTSLLVDKEAPHFLEFPFEESGAGAAVSENASSSFGSAFLSIDKKRQFYEGMQKKLLDVWKFWDPNSHTRLQPDKERLRIVLLSLRSKTIQKECLGGWSQYPRSYWEKVFFQALEKIEHIPEAQRNAAASLVFRRAQNTREILSFPGEEVPSMLEFSVRAINFIIDNFAHLSSLEDQEKTENIESNIGTMWINLVHNKRSDFFVDYFLDRILNRNTFITKKMIDIFLLKGQGPHKIGRFLLGQEFFMSCLSRDQIVDLVGETIEHEEFVSDDEVLRNPVFQKYVLNEGEMFSSLLLRAAEKLQASGLAWLLDNRSFTEDSCKNLEVRQKIVDESFFTLIESAKQGNRLFGSLGKSFACTFLSQYINRVDGISKTAWIFLIKELADKSSSIYRSVFRGCKHRSFSWEDIREIFEKFTARISEANFLRNKKEIRACRTFISDLVLYPPFLEAIPSSALDSFMPLLWRECSGISSFSRGDDAERIKELLEKLTERSLLSKSCCNALLEISLENLKNRGLKSGDRDFFDTAIQVLLQAKETDVTDSLCDKILEVYAPREVFSSIRKRGKDLPDCWSYFMNRLAKDIDPSQTRTDAEKMSIQRRVERALLFFSGFQFSSWSAETLKNYLDKLEVFVSSECLDECLSKIVSRSSLCGYFDETEKDPYYAEFYNETLDVFFEGFRFFSFSKAAVKKALLEGAKRLQVHLVEKILEKGKSQISGWTIGKAIASLGSRVMAVPNWKERYLNHLVENSHDDLDEGAREFESIGSVLFSAIEEMPGQTIPEEFLREAIFALTEKDPWLHNVMGKQVIRIIKYCNQKGLNHIWLELPPEKRGRVLRMAAVNESGRELLSLFVQQGPWLQEIPPRFFKDSPSVSEELGKVVGWTGLEISEENGSIEEASARAATPGLLDPEEIEIETSDEEVEEESEVEETGDGEDED